MTIIIIISATLVAILLAAYAYLGGFTKVKINVEKVGGEVVVYKEVTGDYKNTKTFCDEVYYHLLNDLSIETYKGFGIFYNDPSRTKDKSQLYSEVGCIVEAKDTALLANVNPAYKVKTLPVDDALTVERKHRGGLSILMGYIKVYPVIGKYAQENRLSDGPIMEIYDIPNMKIYYRKLIK